MCLLFDVLVLLFRLFCLLSRAVDLSVYVSTSWLHLHVNKLLLLLLESYDVCDSGLSDAG